MYAIGIDSGTQGTKVLVVDTDTGNIMGRGHSPHAMVPGLKPGENEQHPAAWIRAFEEALEEALKDAGIDPTRIVSLGVSGQQHGFVPLDKEGRPIRPAKLWNDTSTIEETEAIVERLGGPKKYIEKLGISLAVGYTASKILWMKKKEPGNYKNLATVLLPHNYLNFYLTGIPHMEYGDASGTGLMDIRRREWQAEALEAVDAGLRAKLPGLRHPRDPVGVMKESLASKFGLKKILISGGGGDNMMAAIGTGNVASGACTLSLGTSGTIYAFFDKPFSDPQGEIAAFCDSTGGWLPLLCTMNATGPTEFMKDLFKLDNAALEILAAQAPAGSAGLLFLPFVDGERVPALPEASGTFFGLNRRNFDPSHMARSVMEGTILNLGYGFGRMRKLGLNPTAIRATGGGAKNRLWLQIVADILKTPVATLHEKEAAAFGAAIQSIWTYWREKGQEIKIKDLTDQMVKIETSALEPNPGNFAIYDALQERFNSLWKTLKEEFKAHKKLLEKL